MELIQRVSNKKILSVFFIILFLSCVFFIRPGSVSGSEEGSKRVFYCGTVSYISTEMGNYAFEENLKGGGFQKTTKSVNTEIKGQWSICMESGLSFGGMVMASGESENSFKYQHSRGEYYEYVDASEECGGNRPAARPGTRTVTEEKEEDSISRSTLKVNLNLNAVNGTYAIMLVSEALPVLRTSSRNTTVTKKCNPSPPPENTEASGTIELPIMATSEEKPWTTEEYVSGSFEINEDEDGGRLFLPGDDVEGKGSYSKRSILAWDLKRKESGCTARVKKFRGDATLNDMPLGDFSGEVPFSNGDRIKTGTNSRIQLQIPGANAVYRFGSDTDFTFTSDPCDTKNTRDVTSELMTGSLYSVISKLSGSDSLFEIKMDNCTTGARGFFHRLHDFFTPIEVFASEPEDNPTAEKAVLPDDMGSGDAAFYLWAGSNGAVGVKIFKGRAIVEDQETGKTVNLTTGQSYSSTPARRTRPTFVRVMK